MNAPAAPSPSSTPDRDASPGGARQVILVIAGIWFLFLALPATSGEPTGMPDFLRGLAFGLALLAIGQIRWSSFRGLFGIG